MTNRPERAPALDVTRKASHTLFASHRSSCYVCGELTRSDDLIHADCKEYARIDPYETLVKALAPENPVRQPEEFRGFRPACTKDPDKWFSENQGDRRVAKWLCGRCPMKDWCAEQATQNDEPYGIWGGTTDTSRKKEVA